MSLKTNIILILLKLLYLWKFLKPKKSMRLSNFYRLPLLILIILTASSCGKNNSSRGTGWGINSKNKGFQYNTDFEEQETGPGLVFIEGGTFTKGQVQDDIIHDYNNSPSQQHVMSFYIDETEVTNIMYMEYLDWLESVFPQSEPRYRDVYKASLPDTLVWRNALGYVEELTTNYLRHPAYAEYPVVGISWVQAVQYAEWRTDRVNEFLLERESYVKKDVRFEDIGPNSAFSTKAYLTRPELTYGSKIDSLDGGETLLINSGKRGTTKKDTTTVNVYAGISTGLLLPSYRLPTETEWEYAALALVGDREYNNYKGKKKYPWDGGYTRSQDSKMEGDQLANFKFGKGDYGGIAGWSDDGADITIQVKSYPPNDFGIYDMAGNVAEWVADVYRPIIDDEFNDFNYYRGNVFFKNIIGEDGKARVIPADELVYDTLPNGRVILKKLPGELDQVAIDEEETFLRQNFSQSDNRNFRDGDKESTRKFGDQPEEGGEDARAESTAMYDSPNYAKVSIDEDGKVIREIDKNSNRTSLITDAVRVYKGGSWKDRAYWLDPAQRRYLPQYMASASIGFRCAMSRVGSKSKKKKSPRHKRGR